MKYFKRSIFINKVSPYIDKSLIKVIVGQRRIGKSYFMYQLMDVIRKKNSDAVIIYINKEDLDFETIRNYADLVKYVNEHKAPKGKTYLFIDEIQDIEQFERALRHFQTKGEYDIYCTGSNSEILSGELSTYLSGRYRSEERSCRERVCHRV